jgi:hypothetical protein
LSREHQGPRAVLNALERLARGYGIERDRTRQDLELAATQLRDYQARVGQPFAHQDYLSRLTVLRDQLKAGLSSAPPEPGTEALPCVAELAEQIKALKSSHRIEAAPERTSKRRTEAEAPVTARIRRRAEAAETNDQAALPEPLAGGAWQRKLAGEGQASAGRVLEPG